MAYRLNSKKGRIAALGAVSLVAILAVSLIAANLVTNPVIATHQPADKIAVSGSVAEFYACDTKDPSTDPNTPDPEMCPATGTEVAAEYEVILGDEDGVPDAGDEDGLPDSDDRIIMKNSKPTDVYYTFSTECTILTENIVAKKKETRSTGSSGTDFDEARTVAKMIIAIQERPLDNNGDPIPGPAGDWVNILVSSDDSDGKVTYCDRNFAIKTNILEQIQDLCLAVAELQALHEETEAALLACEESYIDLYLKTKSAHAFTWIHLNLGYDGYNMHELRVVAHLEAVVTGDGGTAFAIVGKRTLIAVPGKLANDATI